MVPAMLIIYALVAASAISAAPIIHRPTVVVLSTHATVEDEYTSNFNAPARPIPYSSSSSLGALNDDFRSKLSGTLFELAVQKQLC